MTAVVSERRYSPDALELWGGIECTVNRVGDHYHDQTVLSGHDARPEDLDLFAELGFSAMRYPVLWERTAPDPVVPPDWTWLDQRLHRLRALGIRPIAGLVHHGSGPRHTNLLDDDFASGLGRYAGLVARRYPWIEEWTPINEPLTTARFSALYGHWYPHRRDERSFWIALLNEVDATRAAMRAIRRINPAARLIQTDDLGHTYATAPLAKQGEFDNMRRWAGWDLLFGRVTQDHPLAPLLDRMGLGDRIRRIADDPCPPDVVGVNHYLTSDRFLDHRIERYPVHLHGGNGRIAYADTEAVRVLDPPVDGLGTALREAWRRYATPLAITEVHNGSTREEQMRWAAGAWDTAAIVRAEGADIHAVTAWSLLGSHGWNTLLTGGTAYESGVYDLASGLPVPTALAALWQGFPTGCRRHSVARESGWWQRPERLLYPPHPSGEAVGAGHAADRFGSKLLIHDGTGVQGPVFADVCAKRGICHVLEYAAASDPDGTDIVSIEEEAADYWAMVAISYQDPMEEPWQTGASCRVVISGMKRPGTSDIAHRRTPLTSVILPADDDLVPHVLVELAIDLLIDGREGRWHLHHRRAVGEDGAEICVSHEQRSGMCDAVAPW